MKITVNQILEAKRTMKIVQGRFGDGVTCGCPLTVLFIDSHPGRDGVYPGEIREWANRTYGIEYIAGFLDSFDEKRGTCLSTQAYQEGRNDGGQILQALYTILA